tara:strand:- start:4078 stop:5208 length:1131 start_codon:yes stop_codon:yes gene_type:complete
MDKLTKNMPDALYFAIKAINNSSLNQINQSPAHALYAKENPPEPTPSLKLGSLFHTLVLEPDEFDARYHVALDTDPSKPRANSSVGTLLQAIIDNKVDELYYTGMTVKKPLDTSTSMAIAQLLLNGVEELPYMVEPEINRRTKEGKEQWAKLVDDCEEKGIALCKQKDIDTGIEYSEYIKERAGREIYKQSDFDRADNYKNYLDAIGNKEVIKQEALDIAKAMALEVSKHPAASALLKGGDAEVVLEWLYREHKCKAKVDWLRHDGLLVDLKSTKDASKDEFMRSISKFGYHRQDSFYSEGFEAVTGVPPKGFVFVCCESKPPHAVGVYVLDQESKDTGAKEIHTLRELVIECIEGDHWPAYSDKVETISLPGWHK